jgi:hypothetical protein
VASFNERARRVSTRGFPPGRYKLNVTVSTTDQSSACGDLVASTKLEILSSAVVASIGGSANRSVSAAVTTILDARSSFDPSPFWLPGDTLRFAWDVVDVETGASLEDAAVDWVSPVLQLPSNLLQVQRAYVASVIVSSSAGGLPAMTSVRL